MSRGRDQPSYLPAVEDPTGTYYEVDSINFLVDNRLNAKNNETHVCQTWTTLLVHVFPAVKGYSVSTEMDARAERLDLQVSEIVYRETRDESVFFVVQCKRPSYDGVVASWKLTEEQLLERLNELPGCKWGAVSIGKSVQFYANSVDSLTPLHTNPLRLDREYQAVQYWLDYIKERS
ncbi:hypothetical protein AK830_g8409 [Neonectria ditissima]|uniref:Uncharacterized protein n=1 Tax=Neonectria ditissima TaxID=78410 RepID=A0A0P7BCJ5_9HYPO|nr:hypothetical protein AK830_g8409 [Neonectria ditissima]